MMPEILIVDDDASIRHVVRFALEKAGFSVREAGDGRAALDAIAMRRPALVVLDVRMPELDGNEVCREIRKQGSLPIVFLSSNDDEIDRVLGLEMGGDDYVTKPFSPRELVARIKAVLRRAAPVAGDDRVPATTKVLRAGALLLDSEQVRVFVDETEVTLTATEFGILRTLLGFVGKAYTRDELMNGAYGHGTFVSDRTIDSHVRRIRQKLGQHGERIETVHGVGYRLR